MTRNYGRAPRGERVPEATPNSHWHTLTMLAALTTRGLQAPMTIESPTDGDVFLEARGARLLYLPPYSPDFNPIEQAWSKIKQLLRSAKARSVDALENAIAEALAAITAENALAWFSHCGYGLQ